MTPFRWNPKEHLGLFRTVLKWSLVVVPVAACIGSACALFLWSLDRVTALRWQYPWLLFLLPVAGVAVGLVYHLFGKSAEGGNNLIMEQIHEPGGGVPRRMAPLILLGTIITHLFGGSAGREGTAIQMGGSIASAFRPLFRFHQADTKTLLMAGIAAGFGGVFGTPLAGAIFAMEVLTIGRMSYEAIVPCLIAALVGDWACMAWGVHHTSYHLPDLLIGGGGGRFAYLNGWLLAKVVLAAFAFGLASVLFAELSHGLSRIFKKVIPQPFLRPVLGGVIVIGLVTLVGTRDYLGLGVSSPDPSVVTILSSFHGGGAHLWSWLWKILFTSVTLASGFKGGEVTPLFFIGASLGNTLAVLLNAPPELFAAIGFVAIFAGATNTPLASTIMGVELFGSQYFVYIALACFLAYYISGHSSIYHAQRIATPKIHSD